MAGSHFNPSGGSGGAVGYNARMKLSRRLALTFYRAAGGFPAKLHGKPYRFVPEDRKFWRKAAAGEWEQHTFAFLEHCLRADSVCLDVGAWIGPTVLFSSARCRTVYCIEPDPVAYERLLANLRLNDVTNVLPFHGALSRVNGCVQIANADGFGNSETRVQTEHQTAAAGNSAVNYAVPGMTLSSFIAGWGIEKIDLLKMDIEGAEFDLVPALIDLLPRFKPCIHLSLHAPLLPESARREQLAAVVELAERYAFCYDKRLKPIQPADIMSAPFATRFNAVALTDRALV